VRKIAAGLVIGLAAAGVAGALGLLLARAAGEASLSPLEAVELKTYDWRLRTTADPATASREIVLVEIDEYSLRRLQSVAGRWPWPRVVHSSLLDYLARGRPRVIAYDVNFADPDTARFQYGGVEWTGEESDGALIDAVRGAGNVILLADATLEGYRADAAPRDQGFRLDASFIERTAIFPPFGALGDAAAALGHNLFVLDADGPIRHAVPFVRQGERYLPSLGVAAALRARDIASRQVRSDGSSLVVGDRRLPLETRAVATPSGLTRFRWALINFRGPALLEDLKSRPYTRYSFYDLFYSEQQILSGEVPQVDPAVFRDRIVFVGVTAAGLHDVFETPFSRGKMPGIQVHAAIADDLLSGRFMRRARPGLNAAVLVLAAVPAGVIATTLAAWYAAGLTALLVALLAWIGTAVFANGVWLTLAAPALASALALFGGVSYQYFVEGREKRAVKRLFGRYVSRDIYERLLANPSLAQLGGERRDMTVLFSDIRGFTSMSESGRPEDIVALLNVYFTRMVDIVFRHHGTVDKFVGDMVMALFGAPLDDPDHADHAIQAAIEMTAELDRLNAEWLAQGRPALDIGIGINTGPMIAGNIGSEAIMSYTVIGDAVNLGARLESLNRTYGTRIIISDTTRARLKGPYTVRPLGEVVVKGKRTAVPVFEVTAKSEAPV